MKIEILPDYAALSDYAADFVVGYIRRNPGALLCFAAGDTPLGLFARLTDRQERGEADLNSVYYVGLDEWVGLGAETPGSCVQVMHDHFYGPAGIRADRMRVFDGLADPREECREIGGWIAGHGGIGLTVLGIGLNGHIGFNEPGAVIDGLCGVVPLDETSRTVSVKYFGRTLPVEQGVTISAGALLEAGCALLLASGETKADIVRRTAAGDPGVPAARFAACPGAVLAVDRAAGETINKRD